MAEYLTDMNAGNLLTALEDARHITPTERRHLGETIQANSQEPELPIYLRVLAGFGAFIASLCIMGFLAISKIISFENGFEMALWGATFIGCGIGLAHIAAHRAGVALHSFLMQWSFCFVGLGKLLVTGGAMEITDHAYHSGLWIPTLALAGVTAVTWPFYRMSIDRFLSSVAVLLMLQFSLAADYSMHGAANFMFNLLLALELCVAGLLFTSGSLPRSLAPLAHALAVSLTSIVFLFSANGGGFHHYHDYGDQLNPLLANGMLAAALIGLLSWAAGGSWRVKQEPFMLAALGIVLLAVLGAPGIILSIGFLVLGYALHDRRMITGGALLLPLFVWMYYYNLDLTLFAKSAVLAGSGGLLLAGRAYMHYRNFDKEA